MLVTVFMLFIWCANAYTPRCTNISSDTPMTFKPTKDEIKGRYRAEFCTRRDPNVTDWAIHLLYYDPSHYNNCDSNWPKKNRHYFGSNHLHLHSSTSVQIEDTNNCTHVCYSMDMDLIFKSCYLIKSTMSTGELWKPPNDSYHMITNELTIDSLNDNKQYISFTNHKTGVSLTWFLGVPPTEYKVTLCQIKVDSGSDTTKDCTNMQEEDVTRNCTGDVRHHQVACALAPPYGRYYARVELTAPWAESSVFNKIKSTGYYFNHTAPAPLRVDGRSGAVWWAGGGALLLAAAALGAAAARRALRRCHYAKPTRWPQGHQRFGDSEPSTPEPGAGAGAAVSDGWSRAVLVVYAREGERGARLAERLVQLLRAGAGAPVLDIYSAGVLAAAARAPHDWLRAVLAARGTRVLLLQTPALAALYQTHLTETDAKLKLVEPLLGRRVVYREPQFADTLLQYALRLMVLDAHNHHAYHKYYLATLTDLPTEIVPQLVPFRRYPLPHAAATLLRDLAPPAAAAAAAPAAAAAADLTPALQQLAAAAAQFTAHAADHPTYLIDELLVINND